MPDSTPIDLGILLLRLLVGLVLFCHATQKTLGWFSGGGLSASEAVFERLGQRPPRAMVLVAATCELTTAALVTLGLAMPLGAAVGLGTMAVAGASVSFAAASVWSSRGGGEYPLFIAAVLAAFTLLGPGELSVDNALDVPWHHLTASAATALGVVSFLGAVLAAVPPVLRARAAQRQVD